MICWKLIVWLELVGKRRFLKDAFRSSGDLHGPYLSAGIDDVSVASEGHWMKDDGSTLCGTLAAATTTIVS